MLLRLALFLAQDGVLTLVSGHLDPAVDSTRQFEAYSHRGHSAAPSQNPATSAQYSNKEGIYFFKEHFNKLEKLEEKG